MSEVHPAENWKRVAQASMYEVSDLGRVRRGLRLLTGGRSTCPMRYLRVSLRFDTGAKGTAYIHHLVATAFISDRPEGLWALHKDGDVLNCAVSNLYWGTPAANGSDRIRHGRSGKGAKNPNVKLSPKAVAELRTLYASGAYTQQALGLAYGVEQAHVSRIVRKTSWSENL